MTSNVRHHLRRRLAPAAPKPAPPKMHSSDKAPASVPTASTAIPPEGTPNATDAAATPLIVSLLATAYYVVTSVSLTLFNKLLLSDSQSINPAFLLLCQSLTAVTLLLALRLTGRFDLPDLRHVLSLASLRVYAPLFTANVVMLLSSLLALQLTSLLMYNTLRRTSIVFVVAFQAFATRTTPAKYVVIAAAIVIMGALYASGGDLAFDMRGYALSLIANIATAFYLVLVRPVRDRLRVTNLQLVFINALANIPILSLLVAQSPPSRETLSFLTERTIAPLFAASCTLAVTINHATFVNTTTNDPVAQSIAAQVKDVLLLIISVVMVDDSSQRAPSNIHGVMIGFGGSVIYAFGKLRDRLTKTEEGEKTGSKAEISQAEGSSEGEEDKDSYDEERARLTSEKV